MELLGEEALELHNSDQKERKAADDRQTANNSNRGSEEETSMYIPLHRTNKTLV